MPEVHLYMAAGRTDEQKKAVMLYITRAVVDRMVAHLGFRLVHTTDLPESTRTVTDLGNRIIYLPQPGAGHPAVGDGVHF